MKTRRVVIGLMVALMLLGIAIPAVSGCGGDDGGTGEVNTIKWGWVWDLTGRASWATRQCYDGARDYLHMAAETGIVPEGIEIVMETYDGKGDASKTLPGYVYVKGAGADALCMASYHWLQINDQSQNDGIPCIGSSSDTNTMPEPWYIGEYGAPELACEVLLQWLMETWDYGRGKPKVGMLLMSGIPFYENQREHVIAFCQKHSDKLEWFGAEEPPPTTATWTTEAERLKGCDVILPIVSGVSLANFVKEARARGFQGQFLSHQEGALGFWGQVKAAADPADFDGIVVATWQPWWDDDNESIQQIRAYCLKYNPEIDLQEYETATGYISGWFWAMQLVHYVSEAAEKVGAENVDGRAIQEAGVNVDLEVPGFGQPWKTCEGAYIMSHQVKLMKYSAAQDHLSTISEWMTPESMPVC